MRKISPDEFARRLRRGIEESDKRYALFVGAGCSVSSGIPAAESLVVDQWLPRLRDLSSPDAINLLEWAANEFPNFDQGNAANSYGAVIERLFLHPEERQREIERLCDGKFPGFGYATLAQLVALDRGPFNVVLTTNFDDLVADALYLYTQARPLVIHHESLATYIRPTRTRPLVVKLHGDHRLAPHNTAQETGALKADIETQVRGLIHDRGLIFLGYGGNDMGIKRLLEALPEQAVPFGIYWISPQEPACELRAWLDDRDAIWVPSSNFDEIMLLVRDAMGINHPSVERFSEVFSNYQRTYERLASRIDALPSDLPGTIALHDAAKRSDEALRGPQAVAAAAKEAGESDAAEGRRLFLEGLEQYPDSFVLLYRFTKFLELQNDYKDAETYIKRALAVEPDDAYALATHASLLWRLYRDREPAEAIFKKAIERLPSDFMFTQYAQFLANFPESRSEADSMFRRAIALDPDDAYCHRVYADFLATVQHDLPNAEIHYQKAIESQPEYAFAMSNYADFLRENGRFEEATALYDRAIAAAPNDPYYKDRLNYFLQSMQLPGSQSSPAPKSKTTKASKRKTRGDAP